MLYNTSPGICRGKEIGVKDGGQHFRTISAAAVTLLNHSQETGLTPPTAICRKRKKETKWKQSASGAVDI